MNRFLILLTVLMSCSSSKIIDILSNENLHSLLGKEITIIGKASNVKLGAILNTRESSIWIDGRNSWSEKYCNETLEVTGTVIEKYDLPVFIHKEGDPMRSGMPVPEGTNLREASRRYLLTNAKWKIIK